MAKRELKPLKISCTSTDCDNNLHCFKSTQQMKRRNEQGKCRKCGVDLIEWNGKFTNSKFQYSTKR